MSKWVIKDGKILGSGQRRVAYKRMTKTEALVIFKLANGEFDAFFYDAESRQRSGAIVNDCKSLSEAQGKADKIVERFELTGDKL